MKAIPVLLLIVSCAAPTTTHRATVDPDTSIVAVTSRCVDTIRTATEREVAYLYQIQAEIDLRVRERFPRALAFVALTPDDSLSLYIFEWSEAMDISPKTATFSFLAKSLNSGTAYVRIVSPAQNQFNKGEMRRTGVRVIL